MAKDIILDHKDIRDPQTITGVVDKEFKKAGLDMHRNDVTDLHDDHDKGIRKLTVETPRLYVTVPPLPWKKDNR